MKKILYKVEGMPFYSYQTFLLFLMLRNNKKQVLCAEIRKNECIWHCKYYVLQWEIKRQFKSISSWIIGNWL